MARNFQCYGINGVTDDDCNAVKEPDWLTRVRRGRGLDGFNAPISLETWADEKATRHKTVKVAYDQTGDADDTSEFVVSDNDQMVVDADTGERIAMVSDRFNLIQNQEVASTLTDVLENFNLQDSVFGEVRDYKSFISMDIYFDSDVTMFQNPDTQDTMAFGLEVRAAHDATSAVRVRPFVRDGFCTNTIRGVADWRDARHIKSEGENDKDMTEAMYQMFAEAVFELGYLADTFMQDVARSLDVRVNFESEDFDLREFYTEWLPQRTPQTVIDAAYQRAHYRGGVIDDPDAEVPEGATLAVWAIVSGVTYALTHASNMTDGSNRDRYHRLVKDALATPAEFVSQVRTAIETADEPDATGDIVEKAALTERELAAVRNDD